MIELSLLTGRPVAELYELDDEELATLVEVVEERAGHAG